MTPNEAQNLFLELNLFSKDECNEILKFLQGLEDTTYVVKLGSQSYENGCSMKSADLIQTEETQWIFDKVKNYISSKLNVEFTANPHAVFRRYVEGDYFLEHRDHINKDGADKRYFTVSVQLTPDNEYEGGNVKVNQRTIVNKNLGSAAIWGSNILHEVSILTKGSRTSLIFFVSSKHIKFNNSSLI